MNVKQRYLGTEHSALDEIPINLKPMPDRAEAKGQRSGRSRDAVLFRSISWLWPSIRKPTGMDPIDLLWHHSAYAAEF
jgi:hypothetical protein